MAKVQMDHFSEFDVSAFLPNVAKQFCPECGEAIIQCGRGRPRVFCCDACRRIWNQRNPKPDHWSSAREVVCPMCGKVFLSAKELYKPRKYCSHACANMGRSQKVKTLARNI